MKGWDVDCLDPVHDVVIPLRRMMIEEDLGLPVQDDPQTASLRKIICEELERRFGPEGNCGPGCNLKKTCENKSCIFPVKWR
jgi:hypothetical protein